MAKAMIDYGVSCCFGTTLAPELNSPLSILIRIHATAHTSDMEGIDGSLQPFRLPTSLSAQAARASPPMYSTNQNPLVACRRNILIQRTRLSRSLTRLVRRTLPTCCNIAKRCLLSSVFQSAATSLIPFLHSFARLDALSCQSSKRPGEK